MANQRRYDLDWLRVSATLAVLFFHSSRFWSGDDWHVTGPEVAGFTVLAGVLVQVIMPLFFVVSGVSAVFALQAPPGRFLLDKVKRLLVPLVFGIVILSPPQVYLDKLSHGLYGGDFWSWLPQAFQGWYMGPGSPGNFAWEGVHLWYLLVLLIFALLTVGLARWARRDGLRARLGGFMAHPAALAGLPIIVLALAQWAQNFSPELDFTTNMGSWNILVYFLLYLAGLFFLGEEPVRAALKRRWGIYLAAGVVLMPALLAAHYLLLPGSLNPGQLFLVALLRAANVWCWLLGLLGMASARLNYSNRFLAYANEMVLPFYMLHQPLILIIGFQVLRTGWNPAVEYLTILPAVFLTVLLLYEGLIRRLPPLRVVFGLKTGKRALKPPDAAG